MPFSNPEIIWLLKVASRLIKYSNFAFSRSFCAAMNYWFPELVFERRLKFGERKLKMIMNRSFRNPQFVTGHEKSLKVLRIAKQINFILNFKIE